MILQHLKLLFLANDDSVLFVVEFNLIEFALLVMFDDGVFQRESAVFERKDNEI